MTFFCQPKLKSELVLVVALILYFPFFNLLPIPEPYIEGGKLVFWGLGILAFLNFLFTVFCFRQRIYCSVWETRLYVTLLIILFHSLIFKNHELMLSAFSLLGLGLNLSIYVDDMFTHGSYRKWQMLRRMSLTAFVITNIFAILEFGFYDNMFLLFGHRHFYGAWYLLFLPLAVYAIKSFGLRKHLYVWCMAGLGAYSIYAGFLIGSSLYWALCLFFLWCFISFQEKLKPAYIRGSGLVILVLGLCLLIFFRGKIMDSLLERWSVWRVCLMQMDTIPFFGVGHGSFEGWFLNARNAELMAQPERFKYVDNVLVEWAHNEWIQCYIEYGVLGAVVFSMLVYALILNVFKGLMAGKSYYVAFLGSVLLCVQSFFFFPFRIPFLLPSVFLMAIILMKYSALSSHVLNNVTSKQDHCLFFWKKSNLIIWSAVGSLCLFIAGVYVMRLLGQYHFSNGYHARSVLKKIDCFNRSVSYQPAFELSRFALAKALLDLGQFDEARHHFRQAFLTAPTIGSLFGWAVCEDLKGNTDTARDLYERIRRINPFFLPAKHNLETLLLRMKALETGGTNSNIRVHGMNNAL